MTNIQFSIQIIKKLTSFGIQTFCISPSSRNAPLVEVLTQAQNLDLFQFFDERSMAFFALGRARRDQRPVAVFTTSGTAVCELLPAVCEAHYSSTPLILVTADRPSDYKNTAAPQCIDQENLLSKYVARVWDLEISKNEDFNLSSWDLGSPIHINVRFDEPLIDQKSIPTISSSNRSSKFPLKSQSIKDENQIKNFLNQSSNPLIIVSGLPIYFPKKFQESLKSLLYFSKSPIYIEPLSQMREDKKLQSLILKSGEDILKKAYQKSYFDGVIRIGHIPVTRFWRDLSNTNLPVLSLSLSCFSGLKNRPPATSLIDMLDHKIHLLKNYFKNISCQTSVLKNRQNFLNLDRERLISLENKIKKSQQLSWMRELSKKIPQNSHIFLGNSLPIREWNLCALREFKNWVYSANRGACGIDGLISTFFGSAISSRPNYILLGDLSLLYDLSAPWILHHLKEYQIHIIVINNFGGQIFKDKFQNPYFLNTHHINFEDFSKMWKIPYSRLSSYEDFLPEKSPSLIEIHT